MLCALRFGLDSQHSPPFPLCPTNAARRNVQPSRPFGQFALISSQTRPNYAYLMLCALLFGLKGPQILSDSTEFISFPPLCNSVCCKYDLLSASAGENKAKSAMQIDDIMPLNLLTRPSTVTVQLLSDLFPYPPAVNPFMRK